jgi:hypothetical protein
MSEDTYYPDRITVDRSSGLSGPVRARVSINVPGNGKYVGITTPIELPAELPDDDERRLQKVHLATQIGHVVLQCWDEYDKQTKDAPVEVITRSGADSLCGPKAVRGMLDNPHLTAEAKARLEEDFRRLHASGCGGERKPEERPKLKQELIDATMQIARETPDPTHYQDDIALPPKPAKMLDPATQQWEVVERDGTADIPKLESPADSKPIKFREFI